MSFLVAQWETPGAVWPRVIQRAGRKTVDRNAETARGEPKASP